MSNRIASFVRYLRVSPFDGLKAEDRAAERYRRVVWTIATNVGAKALAMLVMLITVRLTLSYLGSERFGVWITVSGFAAVLSFLDLGIGNALVNETAHAAAKNDTRLLRQLVSNGLTIMVGIGLIAAMILISAVCLFPSEMLFRNVAPSLHGEIRDGLLVFVVLFAIGIPLQGVQRIAAGLQQAYLAHAVSAGASAVSLVLVVWLSNWKAPIPLLLCATYGTQVTAPLVLLVILYRRGLLGLPSSWRDMRTLVARLWGIGSLFLVLQVAVIAGWGMDNLVVSVMLGTSQVVALALVKNLYDLAYQPIAVFNAPLWAAYADALAHGDRNFVSSTLASSMMTTLSP